MTSTEAPVRLTDVLSRAECRLAKRIEQAIRPSEITLEQWRLLSCLSDGVGHPMSEVAQHVLVPPPTLTKQVDKLVDRNLVYRRVDDKDRRRVLVFLSPPGRQLFRKLDAIVRREEAHIVDQLGADDVERFLTVLDAILRLN